MISTERLFPNSSFLPDGRRDTDNLKANWYNVSRCGEGPGEGQKNAIGKSLMAFVFIGRGRSDRLICDGKRGFFFRGFARGQIRDRHAHDVFANTRTSAYLKVF